MANNRILIYGYHGMGNVGADARLLAIRDVLHRLAPEAEIIVNSFNRTGLNGIAGIRPVPVHPARYSQALPGLLAGVDLMVLSEGNMLTDEFTAHMVKAFVAATRHACRAGVPAVGMALDSGRLHPSRVPAAVGALNSLALLTVRADGAADRLQRLGVRVPIHRTADCAVAMQLPDPPAAEAIRRRFGIGGGPTYGLAPVDFYMWPAAIRPFGRPSEYVQWPFKGTWPDGGRARSAALVDVWVAIGRRILAGDRDARLALVAMERVDERFCERIISGIGDDRIVPVYSSALGPEEMSACLGGLTTLVTSRYHALVLSLPYGIPYVAVGHDTRTRFISAELGLDECFVAYDSPDLAEAIASAHGSLLADRDSYSSRIRTGLAGLIERERDNERLLAPVLARAGLDVAHPDTAPAQSQGGQFG